LLGIYLLAAYMLPSSIGVDISPSSLAVFAPVFTSGTMIFFVVFGSADRSLLRLLIRRFDFWYLILTIITYTALDLYRITRVWQTDCISVKFSFQERLFQTIISSWIKFAADFVAIIGDAMVFLNGNIRITVLLLTTLNNLFWMFKFAFT
jgi:hypothetical protein